MLFLVVSTPRPERPSTVVDARQSFWPWIANYQAQGLCKQVYARAGRGAVAILDVAGNDVLHRILTEWADIIPAQFDVYPLIDRAAVHAALRRSAAAPARRASKRTKKRKA
jgi:muconolactone delta-isomerase